MANNEISLPIIAEPVLCDAMTVDIAFDCGRGSGSLTLNVRAVEAAQGDTVSIYFGLRDPDTKVHLTSPQKVPQSGTFVVHCTEHDRFLLRLDFAQKTRVEVLRIIDGVAETGCSPRIRQLTLLHRDGRVIAIDGPALNFRKVDPAKAMTDMKLINQDPADGLSELAFDIWKKLNVTKWLETAALKEHAALLDRPSRINQLLQEINFLETRSALEEHRQAVPYVISKHSINPSWLTARSEQYLKALDLVFAHFSKNGITCFLAYGTLLGALRNSSFIPHDDDVDLIIDVEASSPEEMNDALHRVASGFQGGPLKPRERAKGLQHLMIDTPFGGVDIFSFWVLGNNANLLMENYRFRGIDLSILRGETDSSVDLYDRRYPAPPKAEEFMIERYGPSWRTPDPFHEWPWPLFADR